MTAGRPKQDNQAALREVLSQPTKKEVFIQCIQRLVDEKQALATKAEFYNDDVKSTAETYSLGKGFLSSIVNDIAKDDLKGTLAAMSDKFDVLELFDKED